MLRSIEWIEADLRGRSFEDFSRDRRLRQLVERNIETVSEASRRIPDRLKAWFPDIPWRAIAGIGNVLRHEYDAVAPKLPWDTAQDDLHVLKTAARRMLRDIEEGRD